MRLRPLEEEHIFLWKMSIMVNAQETLWKCQDIKLQNVVAKGDYFGMNSENIEIDGLNLSGIIALMVVRILLLEFKLVSKMLLEL